MLHNIHRKINRNGLIILLINLKEPPTKVRTVAQERHYKLPILLDTYGITAKAYGVWGTPTVYLVDRHRKVVARAIGPRPWNSPEGIRVLSSFGELSGH